MRILNLNILKQAYKLINKVKKIVTKHTYCEIINRRLVIFMWKMRNSSSQIKIISHVNYFYYLSQELFLRICMSDKKGKNEGCYY